MQLFGVFCALVVAVSAMRKTALDLVGSDLNEADQGSTSLAQGVAALDQDGQLFAAMDRDGNKEISEVEFEKFKEMGRSINTFVQQGSAQDKERDILAEALTSQDKEVAKVLSDIEQESATKHTLGTQEQLADMTSGGDCCCCEAPQNLIGAWKYECVGDWVSSKFCYPAPYGSGGMIKFKGIKKAPNGKWYKCMGTGFKQQGCAAMYPNGKTEEIAPSR